MYYIFHFQVAKKKKKFLLISYQREISYKIHGIISLIGHYVPQLAHLIIQSKVKFNLKGIAVSITWRYDLKKT